MDSLQARVFGMLKELHARKQQLDRVIAALEALEVGQDKSVAREAARRQAEGSKGTATGKGDADVS